jgi:hypothetical protein
MGKYTPTLGSTRPDSEKILGCLPELHTLVWCPQKWESLVNAERRKFGDFGGWTIPASPTERAVKPIG